jgi:hypothetical protein
MINRLIIILGYTLTPGGEIEPILKTRLDAAISIHNSTDLFLVCGKYPPKAFFPTRCEHTTEAEQHPQTRFTP